MLNDEQCKCKPTVALDGNIVLTEIDARMFVFGALYRIELWPMYASLLLNFMYGAEVPDEYRKLYAKLESNGLDPKLLHDANLGIHCGDMTARANDLGDALPAAEKMSNVSRLVGSLAISKDL